MAPPRDEGEDWLRCEHDTFGTCTEIPAGTLRRLSLGPGCPGTVLQYRVGRPELAGASWWTRTALEEFDRSASPADETHHRWTADELRREIASLDRIGR